MKKTILSLFILASLTAGAQTDLKAAAKKAEQTTAKKDSVDVNNIPLFSLNDLNDLDKEILSELPTKHTDLIRAWIRQRIANKLTPKK